MPAPFDTTDRERALDALAIARREHRSLRSVVRMVGLPQSEVLRHAGAGFEQRGKQWYARPHDTIPREMSVLTPDGPVGVLITDSREASLNAEHANAVQRYLRLGLTDAIDALTRHFVRTARGRLDLAVSESDLDRLAAGAELEYDVYLRF